MSQAQLGENKTARSSKESVAKSVSSVTVRESRPQTAREEGADTGKAPATAAFPEGGYAAWSAVLGAHLIQMCAFGYTTSFGVYQDYYKRVYLTHESSSAISWIGSINAFLVTAMGLIAGRLYDRGYFYHIMCCGSLLLAFSLFMLSLAKPDQYYQILLSQGIGGGLGAGMIYIPSIALVSQYFHKRRALAMTMVASGSSLGAVVHPIMLNNTLNNPTIGFAIAARANAGLIAGLLLIACALMRTRTPVGSTPPKEGVSLWRAAIKFSRDAPYAVTAVGMTVFVMGFYFPLFYLQLDALKHGLSEKFSFYALVIMNASSFLGRLSPGFIANRFGVENIITTSTFVCAVLAFSMIAIRSVASVIVVGVIYGFFAGTYISMLAPFLAVLTDDMSELGARMGIAFALSSFGSLVGTPIDGALLTGDYIWWRPALFSGTLCFTGFSLFLTSIVLLRRRRKSAQQAEESAREKACQIYW